MKKYEMVIECVSDLCVSDGGAYNSSIDTDICQDELGFPYIPARRIKGCLRECGLELREWGIPVAIDRLFGEAGDQPGSIRISDAYLKDYQQMRQEVLTHRDRIITHPQNVLREFSYIRTQTAVDLATGVAEDHSLRTMRVVNRGTCFVAKVAMLEADALDMENCCRVFRHIGVARSRGLGEIKVSLREQTEESEPALETSYPYVEDSTWLEYEIELKEPLMLKTVNGEERTADYIEGSKILGLIAGISKRDGQDAFLKLMEKGELICSNVYLSESGRRFLPVPAYCYSIKNDSEHYIDKGSIGYREKEGDTRQLSQMAHCYVLEDGPGRLLKREVQTEERDHHRRPDDKSIGRATGNGLDGSVLYQISSVSAGQTMKGRIEGSPDQIKTVYGYLISQPRIRLGAGKSAEYGNAVLKITDMGEKQPVAKKLAADFIVKLESPLVLYGDHAAYTTDGEELIREIEAIMGLSGDKIKEKEKYLRTVSVGGYQVTWGMRKPVLRAFEKGSALIFHLEEPMDIAPYAHLWVGERVSEGFGEVTVKRATEGNGEGFLILEEDEQEKEPIDVSRSDFLFRLCSHLFQDYIAAEASREAVKMKGKGCCSEATSPTVSNMLSMCEEMNSFSEVENACSLRFSRKADGKEEKMNMCERILKECREQCEMLLDRFQRMYQIEGYHCEPECLKKKYLQAYLQEIKYLLRPEGRVS